MLYLDNAATTPLSKSVVEKIKNSMGLFGNPSTKSLLGASARAAIEDARVACAESINAAPDEIIFTSGGTEADNWAVNSCVGLSRTDKDEIGLITSEIEHKAILERAKYMERLGVRVEYLPVSRNGIIDYARLESMLESNNVRLVSVMLVNNELGTIQPIKQIAKICRKHNVLCHTDAVQAYGKICIDVKDLDVDLLSVSGHKVHAPKGVGFLYKRKGVEIQPLLFGGGQESGLRSGTENTLGIVGLGEAAKSICLDTGHEGVQRDKICKEAVNELKKLCPDFELNASGTDDFRAGIINFNAGQIDGSGLVSLLETEGVVISNGSACDTKSIRPSHVLKAIGLPDSRAASSFRVSFSGSETSEEIKHFANKFADCFNRLKKIEVLTNGKGV